MKEKVLITGASGFLGFHIINAAFDANLDVYAAIRPNSNVKHLAHLPINYIQLDYKDIDAMAREIEDRNFTYIIHAAGITKSVSEQAYDVVNNRFTTNLALAAAQNINSIKKFVFVSSLAACGPLKTIDGYIKEDIVPRPVTAYGRSKLNAENNISKLNLPVIILRPTAIYGPREKDIFIITSTINKGWDFYIGKNDQKLSFVHGKDVGDIAVKCLLKQGATGIYNITDGKDYTRYDYANIVKQVLNKKAIQLHLPETLVRVGLFGVEQINKIMKKAAPVSREKLQELLATNWGCDITKANTELNFSPNFNLKEGLEETIKWYRQNKWI
jgi:nucleoside-diphosphate-sugar epimerase